MSTVCECFSLHVIVYEREYFDRNIVNICRELILSTILLYYCNLILQKQFQN